MSTDTETSTKKKYKLPKLVRRWRDLDDFIMLDLDMKASWHMILHVLMPELLLQNKLYVVVCSKEEMLILPLQLKLKMGIVKKGDETFLKLNVI